MAVEVAQRSRGGGGGGGNPLGGGRAAKSHGEEIVAIIYFILLTCSASSSLLPLPTKLASSVVDERCHCSSSSFCPCCASLLDKGDDYATPMNLYISRFSDGVLFSYSTRYIKKMATDGGGGVVDSDFKEDIGPGLKSQPGCKTIDQYEFIQLYKLYSTNSYNYTNCIVQIHTIRTFFIQIILRIHTTTQARSVSCEGEARAHLLPQPGRTRLPRR